MVSLVNEEIVAATSTEPQRLFNLEAEQGNLEARVKTCGDCYCDLPIKQCSRSFWHWARLDSSWVFFRSVCSCTEGTMVEVESLAEKKYEARKRMKHVSKCGKK